MKRSQFIKEVLNSWKNTVFTTEEQVESALELFEKLGMLPPETKATPEDFAHMNYNQEFLDEHIFYVNRWDKE